MNSLKRLGKRLLVKYLDNTIKILTKTMEITSNNHTRLQRLQRHCLWKSSLVRRRFMNDKGWRKGTFTYLKGQKESFSKLFLLTINFVDAILPYKSTFPLPHNVNQSEQ
ncbi:hypothetical protein V8G54_007394 [Vigna mungo]|uniref:Uncharacterized protein n=1 Tax=Vigna mungo TaxID=3915 RepID=A0AAQ3S7A9_VIGMU